MRFKYQHALQSAKDFVSSFRQFCFDFDEDVDVLIVEKCSTSPTYYRWHSAEVDIGWLKNFMVEEEIYRQWNFTVCVFMTFALNITSSSTSFGQ